MSEELQMEGSGRRRRSPSLVAILQGWCHLAGPRGLDNDLFRFLNDEIERQFNLNPAQVKTWQMTLCQCIKLVSQIGMPAHLLFQLSNDESARRPQTFRDATEQARNAEESLLACLNGTILPELDRDDFVPIDIRPQEPERAAIAALLNRIRLPRSEHGLILGVLSGLDFSGEILYVQDLFACVAKKANFSQASLIFANLASSTLTGANFSGAELSEVLFRRSDLRDANFESAHMGFASLRYAICLNANFANAHMHQCDLAEASFVGANFENCALTGADFYESDISNTNFRNSNLENAILARLKNATNANFSGAKISDKNRASLLKLGGVFN